MKVAFHKYHGAGNDFILIDNRNGNIRLSADQIIRLCNRHTGIGADGLMFLTAGRDADFSMIYYNSDGKESTMCGNGGRCMAAFARALGLTGDTARFTAADGEHHADILKEQGSATLVKLKMSDVKIPSGFTSSENFLSPILQSSSRKLRRPKPVSGIRLNTGSPHLVIFTDDILSIDVVAEGRKVSHDPQFGPDGINVDFVRVTYGSHLSVRTYERGVENETLSCGTGVIAAALAHAWIKSQKAPSIRQPKSRIRHPGSRIRVTTPGGPLTVSFRQEDDRFTEVSLEGPAEFVFNGTVKI